MAEFEFKRRQEEIGDVSEAVDVQIALFNGRPQVSDRSERHYLEGVSDMIRFLGGDDPSLIIDRALAVRKIFLSGVGSEIVATMLKSNPNQSGEESTVITGIGVQVYLTRLAGRETRMQGSRMIE